MSRDLRELAAAALRGTSRAELPAPTGALAPALASVPGDAPEALLLGRAALLGLHARAGAPLGLATAPPPPEQPAPERPLPPALAGLLPRLLGMDPVLTQQTLESVAVRGWTLNAAQVLSLSARNGDFTRLIWTLADARARATLNLHPSHRQAQKAEEGLAWLLRLSALQEHRQADPETAVQDLTELWAEQGADRRKELLALVRRDLRPEDRPVLELATRDRSPEIAKQARQLLGHLPGPLQDELLALLPQAVKVSGLLKKKVTFGAFELPAALGKPRAGQYDDGDLHRLLGALPTPLILQTLKLSWKELHKAARDHHWSLASELQEPPEPTPEPLSPDTARARLRDLAGQPRVSAEKMLEAAQAPGLDLSAEPASLQTALAVRTLGLFQQEGLTWQARELAALLRRTLSPDLSVPPPTPAAFEMPPRPKKLPTWQTPADWEERQRHDHAARENAALQTWRDLQHTLKLRREWRGALAAQPTPEE
ncbi:DUF5691 domain-containing protein [Deinococcus sp. Leaf326]|uniref:DUF5691 domain-containing protein n=1 Tax=Deinococcus sp. Leaf326 TaxID=1736338 RepID=UPI0006FD8585|nr:DUF5691 domain-containing protein [Deinococcus sp. Leaf326]KQR01031.1 hypothetical protein ASF71_12790 [Deinococcus sp. Leaf326]